MLYSYRKLVGSILRECRLESNMTVKDVAHRLLKSYQIHIDKDSVYGWEEGLSLPSPTIFLAICEIYGIHHLKSFPYIPPCRRSIEPQKHSSQCFPVKNQPDADEQIHDSDRLLPHPDCTVHDSNRLLPDPSCTVHDSDRLLPDPGCTVHDSGCLHITKEEAQIILLCRKYPHLKEEAKKQLL